MQFVSVRNPGVSIEVSMKGDWVNNFLHAFDKERSQHIRYIPSGRYKASNGKQLDIFTDTNRAAISIRNIKG